MLRLSRVRSRGRSRCDVPAVPLIPAVFRMRSAWPIGLWPIRNCAGGQHLEGTGSRCRIASHSSCFAMVIARCSGLALRLSHGLAGFGLRSFDSRIRRRSWGWSILRSFAPALRVCRRSSVSTHLSFAFVSCAGRFHPRDRPACSDSIGPAGRDACGATSGFSRKPAVPGRISPLLTYRRGPLLPWTLVPLPGFRASPRRCGAHR